LEEQLGILPGNPSELEFAEVHADVARAEERVEVGDAPLGDGCLEPVIVRDDPVREVSAIRAAGDAKAVRIDPREPVDRRFEGRDDVGHVTFAPTRASAAVEVLAISRRSTRIAENYAVALRRHKLHL